MTEDQQEMILNLLRAGNGLSEAAAFADVEMAEVDNADAAFIKRLNRTVAEADLRDMATVSSAATDSWQAASRRMTERRIRQDELQLQRLRQLTTDA